MAQKNTFITLVELAQKQTDDAARALGVAIAKQQEAQRTLEMLRQYRNDYTARFQQALMTGVTGALLRNQQNFLSKIDAAIDGQQKIVQQAEQTVNQQRLHWQSCDRERLSYDTLYQREIAAERVRQSKREQKETDEAAARSSHYDQDRNEKE